MFSAVLLTLLLSWQVLYHARAAFISQGILNLAGTYFRLVPMCHVLLNPAFFYSDFEMRTERNWKGIEKVVRRFGCWILQICKGGGENKRSFPHQ